MYKNKMKWYSFRMQLTRHLLWKTLLTVWIAMNGFAVAWSEEQAIAFNEAAAVSALEFNNDGSLLAVGHLDGQIRLLNVQDKAVRWQRRAHMGAVHSLAFSSDGKALASGSRDTTIVIRATDSGERIRQLRGHRGSVYFLRFLSEDTLISGGFDGLIAWNATTGAFVRRLATGIHGITAMASGPLEQTTAVFGDDGVFLIANKSGDVLFQHKLPVRTAGAVGLPKDKLVVFHDGQTLTVATWSMKAGDPQFSSALVEVNSTHSLIRQVLGYADQGGPVVLALSCEAEMKKCHVLQYRPQSGNMLKIAAPSSTVVMAVFAPSTSIAFGGDDGRVTFMDIPE